MIRSVTLPKLSREPAVVLSTAQLRKLSAQAEALKFANGPDQHFWQRVDPSGVHLVSHCFLHRPNVALWKGVDHPWDFNHGGGKSIRALVLCKMKGASKPTELLCDFDPDRFLRDIAGYGGAAAGCEYAMLFRSFSV